MNRTIALLCRWLVVYHHEPLYAFGRSHPSKPTIAGKMIPLLERHQLDLHLSSHDQNYGRTFPLLGPPDQPRVVTESRDEYIAGQGVIYCKVSPGGKKSEIGNQFSRFTVPQQPFIAKRDSQAHHYAVVNVRAEGQMEVHVYSVKGEGTPKSVTDRFVIRQPGYGD